MLCWSDTNVTNIFGFLLRRVRTLPRTILHGGNVRKAMPFALSTPSTGYFCSIDCVCVFGTALSLFSKEICTLVLPVSGFCPVSV